MRINNDNYVEKAEQVILQMLTKNKQGKMVSNLTTSKIRSLLAMTADIYNQVINSQEEQLNPDICGQIQYLRVRFVYEAGRESGVGRESAVKKLVEKAELLEILQEIQGKRSNYILFSHYMEALTAFHRFHNGKD